MEYHSFENELRALLEKFLVVNSNRGDKLVVRSVFGRLWKQISGSTRAIKVLFKALNVIDWEQSMNQIHEAIFSMDKILEEVSVFRGENQEIPIQDIRSRLIWALGFLGEGVSTIVRTSRLVFRPDPSLNAAFSLMIDFEWDLLAQYDVDEIHNVEIQNFYNLCQDFNLMEYPGGILEQTLQVSCSRGWDHQNR